MTPRAVPSVRLDKWLWAARFYKTRNLAKQAVESGHVEINGERAKVSRELSVGLLIALRRGPERMEVTVLALSDQRGGASQAQQLYAETETSRARREQSALERRANAVQTPEKRPGKQQRRRLMDFKRALGGEF